jgi:sigma-B regulation protein RsbU (phosphoserine phosphatase)
MLADAYDDPRFNPGVDKLTGYRTRPWSVCPCSNRDRVVGVAQGINKVDGGIFSSDDLEIFTLLAAQAAVAIVNARLHRDALDKQRMEFDMEVAASVQQGFWPKGAPPLPGFDVAGLSVPCDATGGDYYTISCGRGYLRRRAAAWWPWAMSRVTAFRRAAQWPVCGRFSGPDCCLPAARPRSCATSTGCWPRTWV